MKKVFLSLLALVAGLLFTANFVFADALYGYGAPQAATYADSVFATHTQVIEPYVFVSPPVPEVVIPPYGGTKYVYKYPSYNTYDDYCTDKYGYKHYGYGKCNYYSSYSYSPYAYKYPYYEYCYDQFGNKLYGHDCRYYLNSPYKSTYYYGHATFDSTTYDTAYYHADQHDHILIESIVFDSSVYTGNMVPVKVLVRNIGPYRESEIKIYVTVDGNVGRSESFELTGYRNTEKTIYVKAPNLAGKFALEVKVFNRYHSVSQSDYLYVYAYGTTLVPKDFVEPGYPAQPEPQQPIPTIETETTVTSTPDNPITKVVVKDGKVTIEKPIIQIIENKTEPNFKYASADFSNKELDVRQKGGNLLKISVTNHLGEDSLFSVKTTFPEEVVFVPEQQVLKEGETKTFSLYFMPGEMEERIYGEVSVMQNGNELETERVSVFVAPSGVVSTKVPNNLWLYALLALFALILIGTLFGIRAISKTTFRATRTPRRLEPLMPLDKVGELSYPRINALQRNTYHVPWSNVIDGPTKEL